MRGSVSRSHYHFTLLEDTSNDLIFVESVIPLVGRQLTNNLSFYEKAEASDASPAITCGLSAVALLKKPIGVQD